MWFIMRPVARQYGALAQPLDQILGTAARVRVLRELDRAMTFQSVAGIAKQAGLVPNAAKSALKILTSSGVVEETPIGARTLYRMNASHPFVGPLADLFAAERARREAVRHAVEAWGELQTPDLMAAWLFGSVARRDDTFQSDVDIAVVARTKAAARRLGDSLRETLTAVATRHWLRPNVLPYDRGEIRALPKADAAMWKNLTRDAIALHGPDPRALLARIAQTKRP